MLSVNTVFLSAFSSDFISCLALLDIFIRQKQRTEKNTNTKNAKY